LIVHGRDREEALSRMSRALEMFIVEGIQTSIPLHRKILADPDFLGGDYNLRFLDRYQSRPALAA
jgi:acetyl-CoA carboxylase biotin carboxylase subunit